MYSRSRLDSGGIYVTIDPPGGVNTFVQSINAFGQITGYYVDSNGQDHCFLESGGTYVGGVAAVTQ